MPAILKAISELNIGPFEAAMGRMRTRVNEFGSGQLATLGKSIGAAFSVYAVTRFAMSVGEAADNLVDLSRTTGVGVENLQALQVLFKENGKEAGDVAAVMARLKKSMDEATVSENIARSFQKLGISFQEVATLTPDRMFERIAKALSQASGDMAAGEAAGNLLGRSYAELQGAMQELASNGLTSLRKELLATNQIMGEESVQAASRMQDAMDRAGRRIRTGLSNRLIQAVGGLWMAGKMLTGDSMSEAYHEVFGEDPGRSGGRRSSGVANSVKAMQDVAARRQIERQNKQAEAISAANEWFAKAVSGITVASVTAADSLAKIGGYIGGQSNPAAQMAERQLKIAELQKELQERIAKATEKSSEDIKEVRVSLEE